MCASELGDIGQRQSLCEGLVEPDTKVSLPTKQ